MDIHCGSDTESRNLAAKSVAGRENVPEGKVALDPIIKAAELSELGELEDRRRVLREEIKTEGGKPAKIEIFPSISQ